MGWFVKIRFTPLDGLAVVETKTLEDTRGRFARLFCATELRQIIGTRDIRQINYSRTESVGSVRGLHYQSPPHAEMKLVRCLRGRVWDVAVDLRAGSPTFLRWHAEELNPENARMFVIPEGFAHGFQVLEHGSELLYLHTAEYAPAAEGGILHDDVILGIPWPLPVGELSPRDQSHSILKSGFAGLIL